MLKHVVPCLMGAAMCLLFVVIPLDRYVHTNASGERFAVTPAPSISTKYDVFKTVWWRRPETLRQAREMYSHKSDDEFLQSFPRESEAYERVQAFLKQSRAVDGRRIAEGTTPVRTE